MDEEVEVHSEAGYCTAEGAIFSGAERGIVHYFKNESDKMAQLVCTVMPAELEALFEKIGEPVSTGKFLPPPPMGRESMKRMQDIAQAHRQILYPSDFFKK